jgi:NitT/TauT family transport system substrate-binding protein
MGFHSLAAERYGINFNIIPQNFYVANFLVDKGLIQQRFYIAEPYHVIQGGAAAPKFLYWDAGFDAYTVLSANRS